MENRDYVEMIAGDASEETKTKCLSVMDKYGDNKWWESNEPRVIGYYQINEPILLVDFGKFHEGIESLLGRPVWTHEFGLCWDQLKNEATNAWLGAERTDDEKHEAITDGMMKLQTYAAENGKEVIVFNPDDEGEEE